jgi:FkbM family methyltransferase
MIQWTEKYLHDNLKEIISYGRKNNTSKKERLAYEFSLWKRTSADNGVILYGAGNVGNIIYNFLKKLGIEVLCFVDSDKNKTGMLHYDLPVLLPEDAGKMFPEALCIISINIPEISEMFYSLSFRMIASGVKHNIHFNFLKKYGVLSGYDLTKNFHLYHDTDVFNAEAAVFQVGKLLTDEYSREIYYKLIRSRVIDYDIPLDCWYPRPGIYFGENLFSVLPDEVVMDCGAYCGDTLQAYMELYGDSFKKWVFFDPMDENIKKIMELKEALDPDIRRKIDIYKGALGNTTEPAIFFDLANNPGGGSILDSSSCEYTLNFVPLGRKYPVPSFRIDDFFFSASPKNNMPYPTLIKMDIEGSEFNALKGGEKTIRMAKPVLAISIYHKSKDLWEIPLWINEVMPDANLFLRANNLYWDFCVYAIPSNRISKK